MDQRPTLLSPQAQSRAATLVDEDWVQGDARATHRRWSPLLCAGRRAVVLDEDVACVAACAAAVVGTCILSHKRRRPRLHPPLVAVACAWRACVAIYSLSALPLPHHHAWPALPLLHHADPHDRACCPAYPTRPPAHGVRSQRACTLYAHGLSDATAHVITATWTALPPSCLVLRTPSPRLELCWRATKRAQRSGAAASGARRKQSHTHVTNAHSAAFDDGAGGQAAGSLR